MIVIKEKSEILWKTRGEKERIKVLAINFNKILHFYLIEKENILSECYRSD